MHDVQPVESLLFQPCKERCNLVSDESGMSRRDLSALNVLSFELNPKSVNAFKGQHSVLETMIDHAD
jgi:hypothetical protein